jgi:hypothetical protein
VALKQFQNETMQNELNDQLYASQFTEFANRNVRADHMRQKFETMARDYQD